MRQGHTPYRRDCAVCVEACGRGRPHRRRPTGEAFTMSLDISGPYDVGVDLFFCWKLHSSTKFVVRAVALLSAEQSEMESSEMICYQTSSACYVNRSKTNKKHRTNFFFSHAVRAMTAQTVVRLRKTTRMISKTWKAKQQNQTQKTTQPNKQTQPKTKNPQKSFEIAAGETVKRRKSSLSHCLSQMFSTIT